MISGLIGLVFNPAAWLAIGMTALVSFGGGVFKGWSDSRSEVYRTQVVELKKASERKDRLIQENADRYLQDQEEAARLQERLNEILASNDKAAECKPSGSDIDLLRKLGTARSLR